MWEDFGIRLQQTLENEETAKVIIMNEGNEGIEKVRKKGSGIIIG